MLLIKRRKPPHAGQWDGIGGKLEPGEDPFAACIREMREETGLVISSPQLRALLVITVKSTDELWLIFVFSAETPQGTLAGSDEGEVAWVAIHGLGSLPVVPDLPMLLSYLDRESIVIIRQDYETDDAASVVHTQVFAPPR